MKAVISYMSPSFLTTRGPARAHPSSPHRTRSQSAGSPGSPQSHHLGEREGPWGMFLDLPCHTKSHLYNGRTHETSAGRTCPGAGPAECSNPQSSKMLKASLRGFEHLSGLDKRRVWTLQDLEVPNGSKWFAECLVFVTLLTGYCYSKGMHSRGKTFVHRWCSCIAGQWGSGFWTCPCE